MNIIRELRKRSDMQQKELAAAVGVSVATVSDWETQKKDPSGERLKKLAQVFNVDPLVILGRGLPVVSNRADIPQTIEAKILSAGIDKMPEADRERALDMMRLVFTQYADYFTKGTDDDDT